MTLSDFIEEAMPAILAEWEAFAASLLPSAAKLDAAGLRDHAEEMLVAIAADLRTAQTPAEQAAKGRGERMGERQRYPRTAAELHAVLRAGEGFTIDQLVSEYRALRASVLRLYAAACPPGPDTLDDVGRFNEAVDQAIAESVQYFAAEVERWRQVFLGVLAHDLVGPLNAIQLTTAVIARLASDAPMLAAAERLNRSGLRMKTLLDDLLDYNRTSLGLGLPVVRRPADLQAVCADEIELRRLAHPDAEIRFACSGPLSGRWDASRMRQLLGNLVDNAAKYGTSGEPIEVRLTGSDREVQLAVVNRGEPASRDELDGLFEPLRRLRGADGDEERRHLGLGLFVVREVARAHGGRVEVATHDGSTVFTVHLPRDEPA